MINYQRASLDHVSVHMVGNKNNGDDIRIAKTGPDISDPVLKDLLIRFFLSQIQGNEFYNFSFSNGDHTLNPVFTYAKRIFEDTRELHINSVNIAKHLYETSNHPNIKPGDLFVAHFSGIEYGHKVMNAIGIFKSETKQAFLKLEADSKKVDLGFDEGIHPDKLDKACLILETDEDSGYQVCISDRTSKQSEAQFWKDQFLDLKPCRDEYHQTRDFLNIAKNFVTEKLKEDFVVDKTDQIDMLNRSMEYFKTHDNFEKETFEQEVFRDEKVISSFRKFDEVYREENDIDLSDNFEISLPAVKKQAKVFKSILKLDRNFHIYIHGNKDMIEKGTEKDGRKYYKIYYDKEE